MMEAQITVVLQRSVSHRDYVPFATFSLVIDGTDSEFGPLSTIYTDATEMIGGVEVLRRDSLCRPYIKFNCLDAMDTTALMVRLTVFDEAGNSNICMVDANVQDNSPIDTIVREGDLTISCTEDFSRFLTDDGTTVTFLTGTCGIPMAPDNFTARVDTNTCGIGTIVRTWNITDDFNNSLRHTQTITLGREDEKFSSIM